jgi:DNA polymerase III epsilon subunit-like protein
MTRQIILDTETTDLEPSEGHRIIENRLRGVDVLAASRCKRKFESSLANQAIISNASMDFLQ